MEGWTPGALIAKEKDKEMVLLRLEKEIEVLAIEVVMAEIEQRKVKDEIRNIHKATQSNNEEDYPCTCGGWCQKEFE